MKRKKLRIPKVEKYYRWLRLSWHRGYRRAVRSLEQELGYEIHAC